MKTYQREFCWHHGRAKRVVNPYAKTLLLCPGTDKLNVKISAEIPSTVPTYRGLQ